MPPPETPLLTVDVVVEIPGRGLVLVKRKYPPPGWALPGGFVERGEPCEVAAAREVAEETGLCVENLKLLGVYSDPKRDRRFHTCSVVYTAIAAGEPRAADDAAEAGIFTKETIPEPLAFDHARILGDYFYQRRDVSQGDRAQSYGIILVDPSRNPRRYLLLRKRGKTVWEFPKGRGESGESPEEAARREVMEETGLGQLTLVPSFFATGSYERKPGSHRGKKDVGYFLSKLPPAMVDRVSVSTEHDEAGWFSADEAVGLLSRESFREILAVVEQLLRGER